MENTLVRLRTRVGDWKMRNWRCVEYFILVFRDFQGLAVSYVG